MSNPGEFHRAASGAVIDSNELVVLLAAAGERLNDFDTHLEPMPRLLLLVAVPSFAVRLVVFRCWQAVHPKTLEDPVYI